MRTWKFNGRAIAVWYDPEYQCFAVKVIAPKQWMRPRSCLGVDNIVNLLSLDGVRNWPDNLFKDLKRDAKNGGSPDKDYGDLSARTA